MKSIKEHGLYFVLVSVFIISAFILVLSTNKAEFHFYLNQFQSPFFNQFFAFATKLGEGLGIGLAILSLGLIQLRKGLIVSIAAILGGIVAQFFKRVVFGKTPRPLKFFEDYTTESLNLVLPIEQMNSVYSFPSGHTTEVFALCTSVVLCLSSKRLDVFLSIVAILVGWSRVYLSQHFIEDITAGAFLGTLLGIFAYYLGNKIAPSHKVMEYSLLKKQK